MTEPHNVKFTIDKFGVHTAFACTAPVDSPCRRTCVVGCEDSLEGYRCQHDIADSGRCLLVQWFKDSGEDIDCYAGDEHPVASGPVHLAWEPTKECVEWRYPS